MKYFLILLGLLFITGCKNYEVRDHVIMCIDHNSSIITYNETTISNVGAFTVRGIPVLAFRDKNEIWKIIDLSRNDCMVY